MSYNAPRLCEVLRSESRRVRGAAFRIAAVVRGAEAIGFGWGDFWQDLLTGDFVDLVASLNLNRWRDRETIQLKIKDLRKAD